jgi:hypothetical protein
VKNTSRNDRYFEGHSELFKFHTQERMSLVSIKLMRSLSDLGLGMEVSAVKPRQVEMDSQLMLVGIDKLLMLVGIDKLLMLVGIDKQLMLVGIDEQLMSDIDSRDMINRFKKESTL